MHQCNELLNGLEMINFISIALGIQKLKLQSETWFMGAKWSLRGQSSKTKLKTIQLRDLIIWIFPHLLITYEIWYITSLSEKVTSNNLWLRIDWPSVLLYLCKKGISYVKNK